MGLGGASVIASLPAVCGIKKRKHARLEWEEDALQMILQMETLLVLECANCVDSKHISESCVALVSIGRMAVTTSILGEENFLD